MKKKKSIPNQYNPVDLKAYMALSAAAKLRFLEQMNAFFVKTTPSESKKVWAKLKGKGW